MRVFTVTVTLTVPDTLTGTELEDLKETVLAGIDGASTDTGCNPHDLELPVTLTCSKSWKEEK